MADPEQARREAENQAFHDWWEKSGHAADPTFSLTTQNACHAAWQERASRPAQPAGEAVVWQYRAKYGNEWTDWHNVKDDDLRQKQMDAAEYRDTLELRTLFAHPSPQPADMGKAVEAIDAVIDEYSDPIYDCPTNRAVVVGLKDARQRALRLASEAEGQERG